MSINKKFLDSPPVTYPNELDNKFAFGPWIRFSDTSDGAKRWHALLGKKTIDDYKNEGAEPLLFNLSPKSFLEHASRNLPSPGRPITVSAFADWVYSLYTEKSDDPLAREFGLKIERSINDKRFDRRPSLFQCDDFCHPAEPSWRLLHNGLHFDENHKINHHYRIDELMIGGIGLRASPDLVFFNETEQKVIIVEIKFSRARLPSNLWPNVWAQLWAYAQIPDLKKINDISVVGEVWTDDGDPRHLVYKNDPEEIYLRRTVRRNPREPKFDRFFRSLFQIYSDALS